MTGPHTRTRWPLFFFTTANAVNSCCVADVALMMCLTGMPRATSASAIMRRWQRHHKASEHITHTRHFSRLSFNSRRPASNSVDCMESAYARKRALRQPVFTESLRGRRSPPNVGACEYAIPTFGNAMDIRCLVNHGNMRDRGSVLTSTSSLMFHDFSTATKCAQVCVEWPIVNNVRCGMAHRIRTAARIALGARDFAQLGKFPNWRAF